MKNKDLLRILKTYKDKNQEKYTIRRIGIFGSAARGTLSGESDIDVVVELENPDLFNLIGIKQDLEELLKHPVDAVRYREKMNEVLKKHIDREAVYV